MTRPRITSALALKAEAVMGLAAAAAAGDFVLLRGIFVGDVTHTTIDSTPDRVDMGASGAETFLGHFMFDIPHVVDDTTRTDGGILSVHRGQWRHALRGVHRTGHSDGLALHPLHRSEGDEYARRRSVRRRDGELHRRALV